MQVFDGNLRALIGTVKGKGLMLRTLGHREDAFAVGIKDNIGEGTSGHDLIVTPVRAFLKERPDYG